MQDQYTLQRPFPLISQPAARIRQKYGPLATVYTEYGRIVLHEKCNGFTIKNTGTTTVIFMFETLNPGQSKSIGGNQDEIVILNENIQFGLVPVAPAVVASPSAVVTEKIFID